MSEPPPVVGAPPEPPVPRAERLTSVRNNHPLAFAGALIGGIGTFVTAVISAVTLVSGDGNEDRGATSERAPLVALETPYTYTGAPVRDDTGLIGVKVPDQWSNRARNGWFPNAIPGVASRVGPGLNASPSIAGWNDPAAATPGIFLGASSDPGVTGYTPRSLLETVGLAPCSAGAIEESRNGELVGALVEHTCPGEVRWFSYAWSPGSGSYLVFLQVKLVSKRDEGALRRILTTLDVSSFADR
jgi:hypothetical protein